jgi:hypothetical protein
MLGMFEDSNIEVPEEVVEDVEMDGAGDLAGESCNIFALLDIF